MKSKFVFVFLLTIFSTLTSCSNDNDDVTPTPEPPPLPVLNGFTWKENGSTVVKRAASATFSSQFKTLIAKDVDDMTLFEINLDNEIPATYTVGFVNVITFAGVNPFFIADSGNVIITANTNNKITGSFEGTGIEVGGITSVKGKFTNIIVSP